MRCLTLFTFFITLSIAGAQPSTLYFEKINTGNGLSHNKVNCILQDKRGFMWIGTEDGLNRYDGNEFLVFHSLPGKTDCISGNIIKDILEDHEGILWIATADGGLSKYDYRLPPQKQFTQYKFQQDKPNSIPTNTLFDILEDRLGFLWLATGGHLVLRFDKDTELFEEPVLTGTRTALSIGVDHHDILWVGRQGGGILKINTRTLEHQSDSRYENLYAKLPHVAVTSLFEDSDHHMWYGSWDKVLYRFRPESGKEDAFDQSNTAYSFQHDEISSMAEDEKGRLWFAGRYAGLQMFDKRTNRFHQFRSDPALAGTIADDRVNCLFLDKTGHIWTGTNKGISTAKLEQQFVQQFLPRSFASSGDPVLIYDFYKDKVNTLWVGTSNGIYLKKQNEMAMQHVPIMYKGEALSVTKFFEDIVGQMYLGTNYSLFRLVQPKFQIELLPNTEKDKVMNHIIESRVVSVIRDTINGHPALLVSPYGHFAAYYDLTEHRWVSRVDTIADIVNTFNLKDHLIRKFYRARDGSIWLAMASQGLGRWDKIPQSSVHYFKNNPSDPASIGNNNVYDLVENHQGDFWISTYGGGLQYFNTKDQAFSHMASSANLLEGIELDHQGNLWMISGGVLHQYVHSDSSFVTFDLPDLENAGGISGYIYKDDNGQLYVAGQNYFISFDPVGIKTEVLHTDIMFTDFKIFNHSYSHLLFGDKIMLRYNQNYFTIEFASPHFPGSEKMHYRYKMEGVDDDWVNAGTRNSASYPNTGSGNFIFRVQASLDNGRWDEKMASLAISVVPPVWKRWWFLTLVALLVLAIIIGIQRYRVGELLKRQAIRNRIAQDLHDNIGSTLSSISVYSQVAKIRNEENKDGTLNELLSKISETSNDMISDMNDIVWAINPRNDSMEKIIQRMESFARPLLAMRNIQLTFHYDAAFLQVNLDMEKRKNMYLIFKEAVNNAFKYAGCSEIVIDLSIVKHQLRMNISDNGVGFQEQRVEAKVTLSGNGLDNIRSRANEMGGEIKIQSQPGSGTSIDLTINIP
jgi:ligand-binding sensor domain-containing protein/signal transduction histidine kinase